MRKVLSLAVLCFAVASAAYAAEVYGTITEDGQPVSQGAALKLDCGDASASGTTDEFGEYSIKTSATGDCRLTLSYKGSSPSLRVTLYEKPNRYDLVVKEEAGKLTIARK